MDWNDLFKLLDWFSKFGAVGAVMMGLIVFVFLEWISSWWGDGGVISNIIGSLRGPRQIISHNICPKCQKITDQDRRR